MIYAEKRRQDSDQHGYFTEVYMVWNGDNLLGTYSVSYKPWDHAFSVPSRASRDFHRLASEAEIEARKAYDTFQKLPEAEQDAAYEADTAPDYGYYINHNCEHFSNRPCIFDGSGLVEVTTDERKAFEIAADMANVERN